MKKSLFSLMLCFLFVITHAQKQDYHWIFGNDSNGQPGFGALQIDFSIVPFEVGTRNVGLSFDRNNASIADASGNLLFYTNGCAVANADHEVMMNGDSLNAGLFFDLLWNGNCDNGYPGKQEIIILNDPADEDGYYIIHKTIEYNTVTFESPVKYLKYSYVDMSLENGKGAVTAKNVAFYDSEEGKILRSFLSAVQHENGKDWWIIQPHWDENRYLRILLYEHGFSQIDTIEAIRPHDALYSSSGGNTRFSPDGKSYAYYTKQDGLHVFDFDRSIGSLSNARSYFTTPIDLPLFSSLEFSSNSQYLYFMTSDSLWQADLSFDNLEDGIEFIAEWNGVQDPFATTFFDAALAPDCRIYIRSGSSTMSVHVINKPNDKGQACYFVQQGIQFPYTNSTGTWPNFPRWRVDEEDKCDTSIVSMFGELVFYRQDLEVFPNPTSGPLNVKLPEEYRSGTLRIFDNQGQIIQEYVIGQNQTEFLFDLSNKASGLYHIEYLPRENSERQIFTARAILTSY